MSSIHRYSVVFLLLLFPFVLLVRQIFLLPTYGVGVNKDQADLSFLLETKNNSATTRNSNQTNHENDNSSLCSTEQQFPPPPRVFNPFLDLTLKEQQQHKQGHPAASDSLYSSVRCVGTGSPENGQTEQESKASFRANFVSRTCLYHNLYYRWSDKRFHYWSSPQEENARNASIPAFIQEEVIRRKQVTIGTALEDVDPKSLYGKLNLRPWAPTWHDSTSSEFRDKKIAVFAPAANSTQQQKKLTFLLYHTFHSSKISHFVWDDLMALFSMMDLFFGKEDELLAGLQPVPLFVEMKPGKDRLYRCNTANPEKWNACVLVYRKFFPILFGIGTDPCGSGDILRTGNFLLGPDAIGMWNKQGSKQEPCRVHDSVYNVPPPNTEYVILPSVIVGGGRLGLFGCGGDCMLHRGHQFWRFRKYLRHQLRLPPEVPVAAAACGHTKQQQRRRPAGYMTFSLPVSSTRPTLVSWFEDEIVWARRTYGNSTVRVVDLAKLSMADQAQLLADTAVLVTNHGGGSFATLFLSQGTSAVIYYHGGKRRDFQFHESAGYYQSTWIKNGKEGTHKNYTIAVLGQEYERTLRFWDEYYYPTGGPSSA